MSEETALVAALQMLTARVERAELQIAHLQGFAVRLEELERMVLRVMERQGEEVRIIGTVNERLHRLHESHDVLNTSLNDLLSVVESKFPEEGGGGQG